MLQQDRLYQAIGDVPRDACTACRNVTSEALEAWVAAGGFVPYCAQHFAMFKHLLEQASREHQGPPEVVASGA